MSLATAILPHTVYQDVNRHTTIVSHVEGTRKIVVKHCPMGGSLDLVGTPLDTFVEQFPQLMDYAAQKAAAIYLQGALYIPCSDSARSFLTHLSQGTDMPIKTVADAATENASANAVLAGTGLESAAPKPAAKKTAAAKKVPTPPVVSPAAKKAATKVAPPAPAPVATKKVPAKKAAAKKEPKETAADRKAAQEALDNKQVIQLAKGGAEKATTVAMKEIAAFLEKKPEGVARGKLFEKFSKDKHPGVTKMNINWGIKLGAFKLAK